MWVEQKYISGQSIDYTDANSILLSEFFYVIWELLCQCFWQNCWDM